MHATHSPKCRQEALKSISSVLNVAGKKSVKYYEQLFSICKTIILAKYSSEEEMLMLACAITCLSNLVYTMDETLQKELLGNLGEVNGRVLEFIKV